MPAGRAPALVLALYIAFASEAYADEAALEQRVDALTARIQALQEELARMKAAAAAARQAAAAATNAAQAAPASGAAPYAFPQIGPQTRLLSYGEIAYSRPTRSTRDTQADAGRFVIGFQHRFDERNTIVTELEVEHAVASATDRGEVAAEQLYVDHPFTDALSAKAGLFLIPSGLLNESHEPPVYYGVFRNFVETAIIPTTWREIGVGASWRTDSGLTIDAGLTTGFDLSKFDPNAPDARESPLGSIHQEGQLARARSLSGYGAVNWRGVPGLQVGASVFYGGAGQGQDFAGRDAKVALYEGHVRWTPGAWDLSALYARGHISHTAALNETFAGAPTLVPESFYGWYAQAAYRVWGRGDMSAAPFVRYERFNTARSFAPLPGGVAPDRPADSRATTAGLNFYPHPGIVFKADYQWFQGESGRNRLDLGAGYAF